MLRPFILLLLSALSTGLYAQAYDVGLVLPSTLAQRKALCCLNIPPAGFPVYGSPGGAPTGRIHAPASGTANYWTMSLVWTPAKGAPIPLSLQHLPQIGYEEWCLQYTRQQGDWLELRLHAESGEKPLPSCWLRRADITAFGLRTVDWLQFFFEFQTDLLGWYPPETGLNLRTAPQVTAPLIQTLRGDAWTLELTGEVCDLWAEVNAVHRREHFCNTELTESENRIEILTGWVKLLDDSGAPNVWWYPRGC